MYENITLDSRLVVLLELQKPEDMKKFPKSYKTIFEEYIELYELKEWGLAKEKAIELREFLK